MTPRCEHLKSEERYGRTWEEITGARSGAVFEIQVSHRFCLTCRSSFGLELWATKRPKEGAA